MLAESQAAEHERKMEDSAQALLGTMEILLLWSKEQMEHSQPLITEINIRSAFDYIKEILPA